jgi:hypothetical protein
VDFTKLTLTERANHCQNIFREGEDAIPRCADNFNNNHACGLICCGHCPDYNQCEREKCERVWINPKLIMANPAGRIIYVVLATGRLVSGSVPCIISEAYDDNESP